ncbi:DUF445 family protein [Thalassotalea litorea]|uniref:DUF445 family protein n=1 Tax=Thalassotalea litorea TaxID=2020715 RepID=A0A5R9IIA2_9GAMM|nr:DUF445 family protein [Thalassotalea litorea]TLU65270.1 DUF445 family protein [Thalassotalea litorea]
MNKSYITNTIALVLALVGYFLSQNILFSVGVFALSGAITNVLAIHMLFEKVPFLYGSGVIPSQFDAFKRAIANMMMTQFFTDHNIDKFLSQGSGEAVHFDFSSVIHKVDLEPAFHSLVQTIEESSFGSMLAMFGGNEALQPLQQPFIEKMKASLLNISEQDEFNALVREQLEQPNVLEGMRQKVEAIIEQRLDELTPDMVKDIIQQMIRKHLGWLVVWGGVFGGLIGLIVALISDFMS